MQEKTDDQVLWQSDNFGLLAIDKARIATLNGAALDAPTAMYYLATPTMAICPLPAAIPAAISNVKTGISTAMSSGDTVIFATALKSILKATVSMAPDPQNNMTWAMVSTGSFRISGSGVMPYLGGPMMIAPLISSTPSVAP